MESLKLEKTSKVTECRGKFTSLVLMASLFLTQIRMQLTFLAIWAQSWLMLRWLLTNTSRSFSAGELSSHSAPDCSTARGCCDPDHRGRTQHFVLLNLIIEGIYYSVIRR